MFVTYTRVSSSEQGDSKLSLEEQQRIVDRFAGEAVVARFSEVDSGGNCERPELAKALQACRKAGATLLVAKLDRLARDTVFVCQLLDSDVRFVCADMPSADRTMLQMFAVFGEYERRQGSERMKAAWRARKSRPNYQPTPQPRGGSVANKQAAAALRERVVARCRSLRDGGRSLSEIAAILNGSGERTRRGLPYSPTAVSRVLQGRTGGHAGRF
jgi:DNA invertase Pin-like site-specific DNA recombinase